MPLPSLPILVFAVLTALSCLAGWSAGNPGAGSSAATTEVSPPGSFSLPLAPAAEPLPAQKAPDISGNWEGVLLQNPGGIAPRFDMTMNIRRRGLSIVGTTYVTLDNIWAEFEFSGYQLPSGSYKIVETKVLRGVKPEDLSWCMKRYELRLETGGEGPVLTGPWWGNSGYGPCVPGSVRLTKRKPQV